MKNNFSSTLMLSCHNEKHLAKIPDLEAESIMLNLEDGVSIEQKPLALKLCAKYLKKFKKIKKMFIVRVNALDEGGLQEIKYLNEFKPDAIRIPKVKSKKDVQKALDILDDGIELHLSIETALSWKNLTTLKINPRVTTFYLGILDMFADMKLPHSMIDRDNPTMLYMLSHFLIASKSIGIKPVSFVYQDYKNLEEFERWLYLEKNIGYSSKGCISPSQVKLTNKIFSSDEIELKKAKKIVRLFESQRKLGITGFTDEEFGFIDEPIYKGALALLEITDDTKN